MKVIIWRDGDKLTALIFIVSKRPIHSATRSMAPAPLARFKQSRNNEVYQDQIDGVIQDQAMQRYYRPNTRTTLLILITTVIKKHVRLSLSFHASVLTVLCTYLRRADVYISGGGDLIVAPHVCTKAARSGKTWLTVLISDDRYGPGCNANEPHAIAPTTLEA